MRLGAERNRAISDRLQVPKKARFRERRLRGQILQQ